MLFDRGFAYTFGVILLVFGLCGFVPPLLSPHVISPSDTGTGQVVPLLNGELMHLFHVNAVLSGIYVLLGVLGLAMAAKAPSARHYAQLVALICATLALLGFLPRTCTLFGLAPIGGHDIGLNIFLAGIAGVFGFILRAEDRTTTGTHEHRGQKLEEFPTHG